MTEEDHNLRLLGVLLVATLAIMLAMCSCATKTLTEYVEIHDTLVVHHNDTTTIYQQKLVHDTLEKVVEKTVTIKENGDTTRIITNNIIREKVVEKDSIDRYRSVLDSIKSALKHLDEKHEVVKKKDPWYKLPLIVSVLVLITGAGLWLIKKSL